MNTINCNGHDLKINVTNYVSDPVCMAVQCFEDGEPYSVPTVNLGCDIGNNTIMPPFCAFMDTNNSKSTVEAFEAQGLIYPYTRFGSQVEMRSGFCTYPLYQFNAKKLKELDPEGCAEYMAKYQKCFTKMQEMMGSEYEMPFDFDDEIEDPVKSDPDVSSL